MSLKGDESAEVISEEMSKASTAKALIHCDMAVVSNLLVLGSSLPKSFLTCSASLTFSALKAANMPTLQIVLHLGTTLFSS